MDVDERSEDQKTCREIEMKDAAHYPWARDEQRDATCKERDEVCRRPPVRLPGRTRFALLIVAGDPDILRRVHDGKYAAAVARLRNVVRRMQFEQCGHHEPEKLRERQR